MKKVTMVLVCVLLGCSILGCSGKDSDNILGPEQAQKALVGRWGTIFYIGLSGRTIRILEFTQDGTYLRGGADYDNPSVRPTPRKVGTYSVSGNVITVVPDRTSSANPPTYTAGEAYNSTFSISTDPQELTLRSSHLGHLDALIPGGTFQRGYY